MAGRAEQKRRQSAIQRETRRIIDGTALYTEAIQLIHDLRAENAALKEEIERLKQHVVDLNADFNEFR